jgi:hypothetical protein
MQPITELQITNNKKGLSMRTNILEKLANAVGQNKSRDYSVTGEIVFKLSGHQVETDQEFLKCAIVQVAGSFPWEDTMPRWQECPVGGMHRPFDAFKKVNNWRTPEVEYWFTINPCREDMMKSQLHAYEKHLMKLAEELSLMNLPNVCEVRSIIHISRMDTFKVNNG